MHLLTAKASTLEPDDVQPPRTSRIPIHRAKRRDVLHDFGTTTDDAALADTAELMHRTEATEDDVVLHRDVAR